MATIVSGFSAESSVANAWLQSGAGIFAMAALAALPGFRTLILGLSPIGVYCSLPVIQVAWIALMLAGIRLIFLEHYIADSYSLRVAIATKDAPAGMGWIKPELVTTVRRRF